MERLALACSLLCKCYFFTLLLTCSLSALVPVRLGLQSVQTYRQPVKGNLLHKQPGVVQTFVQPYKSLKTFFLKFN